MNDKYVQAGKWNIFCGRLTMICSIIVAVALGGLCGVSMSHGDIRTGIFAFIAIIFPLFGFFLFGWLSFVKFMINMGKNMQEGFIRKGLLALNTLFKIVLLVMSVYILTIGMGSFVWLDIIFKICASVLSVTMLIAIIMDFRAYFSRKENS